MIFFPEIRRTAERRMKGLIKHAGFSGYFFICGDIGILVPHGKKTVKTALLKEPNLVFDRKSELLADAQT